jgi:hypothetical protein
MNTYTWTINSLVTLKQSNNEQNVVCRAMWSVKGTDGTYVGIKQGISNIVFDPNESFVQYDQLTETEVLDWVWKVVDRAATEAEIDQKISNQANPPYVNLPLPWIKQG